MRTAGGGGDELRPGHVGLPADRELAAEWLTLTARLGGRGDLPAAGARLVAAYSEIHRAYHDRRHLAEVLHHVGELSAYAADVEAVRLAAWFHDAVYDPVRSDNEERSAAWAEETIAHLRLPARLVAEVARLVRLTALHDPGSDDPNGSVLCDADLAILAADPDRYAAYAQGVRHEYRALDDAAFTAGRTQVLRALLDRPVLFRTPPGRMHWAEAARVNLEGELRRLERP